VHFHICVVDGVFRSTEQGTEFCEAKPFSIEQIDYLQQTVRRRLLRAFLGRGYLDKADAKQMLGYEHGGGFSVDASVWIGA
jgi:Putative transposase